MQGFWTDESGGVVSAELVMIGTVVTVGAVTGLQTVSNAVDEELRDVTRAIRSLDQTYSYRGFRGCNSMTAGSAFIDYSVDVLGDWPENPHGAEPARPVPQSPDDSLGQAELDLEFEFADEEFRERSAADEPVTTADEKL